MTYYCSNCWHEIEKDRGVCLHCQADQGALELESFVRKLIRALHHPEPETPIRAAAILGDLQATEAIRPLEHALFTNPDPYIAAACAQALGKIGGTAAMRALFRAKRKNLSIIVKRAVYEALEIHTGVK